MKINFENKKVKRYFENFNYIKKEKGIEVAKQVKKRINQLAAAETLVNCESIIIEGVMDYHGGKQEWLIP